MKIFDLHADIGYDVLQKFKQGETNVINTYHLPKWKQGELMYINMASCFEGAESWEDMKHTITLLKSDLELSPEIEFIKYKEDHIDNGNRKALLSVEGMCGIKDEPEEKIEWLFDQGIRIASLCWNDENKLATGIKGNKEKGLSAQGRRAIRKMIEIGMGIDVSHANEKTFWDIVKEKDAKIIATHSNVRALCNHPRNLWDEQIKVIQERGGIIGIVSAPFFVNAQQEKQDIIHIIKHIRYICDNFGTEVVALGFDFMHYYPGYEHIYTKGLKNSGYSQGVVEEMRKNNFSEQDIVSITHGNVLRFLQNILPSSKKGYHQE